MNHTNSEIFKKRLSKEELTWAIQATKSSAPCPDKINNEMLKDLPPEGLHSRFALYNKKYQQWYFPEKMNRGHSNTQIKTWKLPKELFMLSTNWSNKCSAQSNGDNGKCKTVGTLWPEGNTVNTTMWRKGLTNNYRPSFDSWNHTKESPSKQWACNIHLLLYGKSIRFKMETRHPDGHTRSLNRWKNVQFHTKFSQAQIF